MAKPANQKMKAVGGGRNLSPHPTMKKAQIVRKAGKGGKMVTGAKRGKNC